MNESGFGLISGTPTEAGSFRFFLTVKLEREQSCQDTCGSKCSSDDEFVININQGLAKLTLGPEATAPATVSTPYSLQMTATVAEPKTWSISSGALPAGLAIDASTGLISGTPSAAGQFDFTVLAKMNGDARSDTKALGIVVREQVGIAGSELFTTARRAVTEVSLTFDALLAATGGTGTYTWSLTSGALPPGLTLADGAISGTATTAGVYRFTATATDSEARVANYPATIVVAAKLAVLMFCFAPARSASSMRPRSRRSAESSRRRGGSSAGRSPGAFASTARQADSSASRHARAAAYWVTFEATDAFGVVAKKTLMIIVAAAPAPRKSG